MATEFTETVPIYTLAKMQSNLVLRIQIVNELLLPNFANLAYLIRGNDARDAYFTKLVSAIPLLCISAYKYDTVLFLLLAIFMQALAFRKN